MTSEAHSGVGLVGGRSPRAGGVRAGGCACARLCARSSAANFSSSLTRRIVSLNLGGLLALVVGVLWLNHFRADIIEARTQSLTTQAGIIAAAISAAPPTSTQTPSRSIPTSCCNRRRTRSPARQSDDDSIEFSINPEKIGPVLHQLVSPTQTRARIYDEDGALLLDTQTLSFRMPRRARSRERADGRAAILARRAMGARCGRRPPPPRSPRRFGGWAANGKSLPEVADALDGRTASFVSGGDETIVSVAVPIRSHGRVRGALVLSTLGRDIDKVIMSERLGLLRYFGVIAAVMLLLSLSLANTIAEPVRKLAEAAERVRRGIKSRQPIPDFTDRSDEIGHLSRALGEMTQALYSRIDAIESFAADVAHELKNPLTSLRSALETLPRVKTGPSQARLLQVMQHDVRRLDRLISDISDASRLDAELARGEAEAGRRRRARSTPSSRCSPNSPRSRGVALKVTIAERRRRTELSRARPRFAAGAGHHQSRRQRLLVLRARRRGAHSAEPRARRRARELRSDGGARRHRGRGRRPRHSRRTRWSASSSASTPTGRSRASARIPASACRSRGRSSKPISAASGPRTGRCRAGAAEAGGTDEDERRCAIPPARASSSACPRRRAHEREAQPARQRRRARRGRRADSRALGRGQKRAVARADRRGARAGPLRRARRRRPRVPRARARPA